MLLPYLGLVVGILIGSIGVYGLLNSKNIVRILLSSEIIFNSAILLVFSASAILGRVYLPIVFSIFAVSMGLVEVVVAFAAIILYYRNKDSLEVE
ncbi:NADH-quinone oxidoreductase subunit K [Sulfurisphaera javensis]|uniref:NADH-quinone oxidoreductase subunit K n=1 Tax=Sulfurisphaera javensis TaxID=2049879 RepID=A0AAT9GP75_9CREN